MTKEKSHDAIREFMKKAAFDQEQEGKRLKYDPKLKRFVVVDSDDLEADDLPAVTPEDLQSFRA
jgi:hypothetical protein